MLNDVTVDPNELLTTIRESYTLNKSYLGETDTLGKILE